MTDKNSLPKIVAHRGDIEHFPENTLAAFQSAIEKGADIIELDVHQTKDHKIVVHHDFYLDRHSDGQGHIGNYTLEELKRLDAGSWRGKKFTGENIPTLEEIIAMGKGEISFEIEIKTPTKSFVKSVINLIESNQLEGDVEITCQHRLLVTAIKEISSDIDFGLILYNFPDWMEEDLGKAQLLDYLILADAQIAHLPINLANNNITNSIREIERKVHIACNEHQENINHCFSLNADRISTNFLDETLKARSEFWDRKNS